MMKIEKFKNHEAYRAAQISAAEKKQHGIWVSKYELEEVAKIVKDRIPNPDLGICHGVRTGWESETLAAALGIRVIGTDIRAQKDSIVQMDFHEYKEEWAQSADFVYSNSLDHSYDPKLALDVWSRYIKPGGLLLIHWGPGHNMSGLPADCFCASLDEYLSLLKRCGNTTIKTLEVDASVAKKQYRFRTICITTMPK